MQDSTYLCVQVKSDAMPEEPSDDMQEAEKSDATTEVQSDDAQKAEKSDDKPEEAKKEKTQFQRKNTDANPTSPQ